MRVKIICRRIRIGVEHVEVGQIKNVSDVSA